MIRLREDSSLELKNVTFQGDKVKDPDRKDLASEISAIANTIDARLVFGVDDRMRYPWKGTRIGPNGRIGIYGPEGCSMRRLQVLSGPEAILFPFSVSS